MWQKLVEMSCHKLNVNISVLRNDLFNTIHFNINYSVKYGAAMAQLVEQLSTYQVRRLVFDPQLTSACEASLGKILKPTLLPMAVPSMYACM